MKNVSVKNKLIVYFVLGILIFPFLLVMMLFKNDAFVFLLSVLPFWLVFFWGTVVMNLNAADISIDKKTEAITVTTVLKEKKIPIKDFQINNYSKWSRKAFAFYTNAGRIIIHQTDDNCEMIMKLFKITKYKHTKYFAELQNERFGIGIFRYLKW